jgi:hypothetical protein
MKSDNLESRRYSNYLENTGYIGLDFKGPHTPYFSRLQWVDTIEIMYLDWILYISWHPQHGALWQDSSATTWELCLYIAFTYGLPMVLHFNYLPYYMAFHGNIFFGASIMLRYHATPSATI